MLLAVFVGIFVFALNYVFNQSADVNLGQPRPTIRQSTAPILEGSDDYALVWFEKDEAGRTELIANFSQRLNSKEVIDQHACKFLVNAGFYDEEGSPIGFFKTLDGQVSDFEPNKLFNGFVFKTRDGRLDMADKLAFSEAVFGFQTGPLLLLNNNEVNLSLKSDKNARRLLFAKSSDNKSIFMAIYDQQSLFSGPKLADVAGLLEDFEKDSGIDLMDAINLDGGTASVFYDGKTHLKELSPVGSFLCIN